MTCRPYSGPIEALTIDEWAVRLRVSPEHLRKIYTGKVVHLGSLPRIYAAHLHDWLDAPATAEVLSDGWAGVGENDAEAVALSKRQPGKAA